jgi:hypothetical protein
VITSRHEKQPLASPSPFVFEATRSANVQRDGCKVPANVTGQLTVKDFQVPTGPWNARVSRAGPGVSPEPAGRCSARRLRSPE